MPREALGGQRPCGHYPSFGIRSLLRTTHPRMRLKRRDARREPVPVNCQRLPGRHPPAGSALKHQRPQGAHLTSTGQGGLFLSEPSEVHTSAKCPVVGRRGRLRPHRVTSMPAWAPRSLRAGQPGADHRDGAGGAHLPSPPASSTQRCAHSGLAQVYCVPAFTLEAVVKLPHFGHATPEGGFQDAKSHCG